MVKIYNKGNVHQPDRRAEEDEQGPGDRFLK